VAESTRSSEGDVPPAPVNETRAELYARLMSAQEQIAQRLYEHGVGHEAVEAALDAVDEGLADDWRREDLYLSSLAIYVGALGGRLELRAVFDGDAVLIRDDR
jgi:hypothetical protein